MTPERAAALVRRWVGWYTRDLPADVADRRTEELAADLHDHLAAGRAQDVEEGRLARAILSRMVRGVPADAVWRHRAVAAARLPIAPGRSRVVDRSSYRRALALAAGTPLVLFWMVGALGIIGDSGDRADAMYAGVLATEAIGVVVARLRPVGMARALALTAIAQVAVAVIALAGGMVPAYNSAAELLGLTALFVVPFALAAHLFRRSAQLRRT